MAEFYFKFTAEELKNSIIVKNGRMTFAGKSDCPSGGTPYQQLMTAKMATVIKNREQTFTFPKGLDYSGKVNIKLYPLCTHEDENQKSAITFSFEKFDKEQKLMIEWKIKCQKCVGTDSSLFPVITEINRWKRNMDETSGTDYYAKLVKSLPELSQYLRGIEDEIAENLPNNSPDLASNSTITIEDTIEIPDSPQGDLAAGLDALEITPPNSRPQFDPSKRLGRRVRKDVQDSE